MNQYSQSVVEYSELSIQTFSATAGGQSLDSLLPSTCRQTLSSKIRTRIPIKRQPRRNPANTNFPSRIRAQPRLKPGIEFGSSCCARRHGFTPTGLPRDGGCKSSSWNSGWSHSFVPRRGWNPKAPSWILGSTEPCFLVWYPKSISILQYFPDIESTSRNTVDMLMKPHSPSTLRHPVSRWLFLWVGVWGFEKSPQMLKKTVAHCGTGRGLVWRRWA